MTDTDTDTVPAAHHEALRHVMLAERRRAESAESEIARLVLAAQLDEDLALAAHAEAERLTERAVKAEERAERAARGRRSALTAAEAIGFWCSDCGIELGPDGGRCGCYRGAL